MTAPDTHTPRPRFLKTLTVCSLIGAAMLANAAHATDDEAASFGNHFTLYLDTVNAVFDLGDPPQPGGQVLFNRAVYEADLSDPGNPAPTGPVLGANIVICTLSGPVGLLCQGSLTLSGQGSLTLSAPFAFQNPASVAVTGGTGRFAGARGAVEALELNPEGDQLYFVDLSAAKN